MELLSNETQLKGQPNVRQRSIKRRTKVNWMLDKGWPDVGQKSTGCRPKVDKMLTKVNYNSWQLQQPMTRWPTTQRMMLWGDRDPHSNGGQQHDRHHIATRNRWRTTNRNVMAYCVANQMIYNDGMQKIKINLLDFGKFKSLQGSSCVSVRVRKKETKRMKEKALKPNML